MAGLPNGNKSGADAKEGDTRRLQGDAQKHIAGRIVGAPCTGDIRGTGTQAGHQLAEFTPRTDEAAKTAMARQAGEGPCTQGGGGGGARAGGEKRLGGNGEGRRGGGGGP